MNYQKKFANSKRLNIKRFSDDENFKNIEFKNCEGIILSDFQ